MDLYFIYFRWFCKDRRYEIREKSSAKKNTYATRQSTCYWSKSYDLKPADFECVLTYCDNATESPNTTHNYAFTWDGKVVPLGQSVDYPCMENMAIENGTNWKENASTSSIVLCGPEGLFLYPSPWPQCSDTVQCEDPFSLNIPEEIYYTYDTNDTNDTNVYYSNTVRYWYSYS